MAYARFAALAKCERVAFAGRIKHPRRFDPWCARLGIPTFEWVKVLGKRRTWVSVGNALCEVIAGDSLAIMAFKVKRHAFGKTFSAGERLHHAHHLGTFFINGDGVEVIDFDVGIGTHWVRHGTCILGELNCTQNTHVFNAFHSARAGHTCHVLAKFLIAENGQAFFER